MEVSEFNIVQKSVGCVFVGNPLNFSDTALRLVEAELPFFSCMRTAAVNDLLLMEKIRADDVRLIVVDEAMSEDLIKVIPQLRAVFPLAGIVLGYRTPQIAHAVMGQANVNPAWGDISFLPMDVSVDCWLSVVRLLSSGAHYIPSQLFHAEGHLPEALPQTAPKETCTAPSCTTDTDFHLTVREEQVLKYAAEGKQNKIIADELNLSQHTVKLHMHHIIAKLGVHNRTEAANWYHGRAQRN